MSRRHCWASLALACTLFASPTVAEPTSARENPDIDLYALMSGKCPTLKVAGRDFACRAVAYFHSEKGRASFTVALDDPNDHSHIISFSGEDGRRTQADRYLLTVDRMELNSQDRPRSTAYRCQPSNHPTARASRAVILPGSRFPALPASQPTNEASNTG